MYRGRTLTLSFPPFTRAVKWLILTNAAVFLVMALLRAFAGNVAGVADEFLALIPDRVLHGFIWQMITYSFLHAGILHILFNMLGLWWFGAPLEMDWGKNRFLEFYVFCVMGAALTTIAVSYTGVGGITPQTGTIGASGGVLGILMAFGMLYGDREILLYFVLPIKAKYFVAGVAFFELINAIEAARPGHGQGIAYVCHLGGLLFGFLYVKFVPRRGLMFEASENYFNMRNSFYRWKRRRAAKKFEVYMRQHDQEVHFDEHGNYIPPEDDQRKGNGGGKSGWVN
jgi:membrane associated rhomboid family serine protease